LGGARIEPVQPVPLAVVLRDRWRRFWYAPSRAAELGACRLLFYLALVMLYGGRDFVAWTAVSDVFWQPIPLFRTLVLGVLPPVAMAVAAALWKLSLLTSAAGLATRFSTAAAAVLGTYLLGLPHNFGKIHHSDAILVFGLWVLAFARSGDGWSLDSLIRAARRPQAALPKPSGEYTWPFRMMWLVMSLIFFAAGVSKLRHSGLAWITSNALAGHLLRTQDPISRPAGEAWTDWGASIAATPWLSTLLGAGSLALELFFPLALFSRTARRIIPAAMFGVQIGISAVMGPDFTRFLICYLFWVPWERMGELLRRRAFAPPTRRHAFLYDGSCGLCQRTVAVLRRLDLFGRVEFLDALGDWSRVHAGHPALVQDDCIRTMHVVRRDGRVETGFDAYRAIAWSLPLLWPVAPLLYVPGVSAVGRRVYASVAARRHRTGCPVPERPTLSA
jgi:predicted DCC family thiol-disulfide oxidoreductase YuxK